jgi:predicted NAD-dependent protein-ADP-ribosyltransferase YbiA (DUF1768 family)
LFSKQFNWRPKLDGLAFDSIEVVEAARQESPFEKREVLEVVKGMNSDKEPGPNGFFMAFFQPCWNVIKVDIMVVLHDFHAHSKFEKSLNATFIALFVFEIFLFFFLLLARCFSCILPMYLSSAFCFSLFIIFELLIKKM